MRLPAPEMAPALCQQEMEQRWCWRCVEAASKRGHPTAPLYRQREGRREAVLCWGESSRNREKKLHLMAACTHSQWS